MATLPHRVYNGVALFRATRVVLAVLLIGSAGGCAQRGFLAKKLPPQYIAPVRSNIEEIDLSGLANYSVSSETIDLGDVLSVTIVTDYGDQDPMTTPARIRNDGTADIPLIGPVRVAGLELDQAEQAIAAAGIAGGIYKKPHVTVTMERQCVNKITVIGAVEEPGEYEVPRTRSSVLAAIVAAGALSDTASGDVEIRRRRSRSGQPGSPGLNPPRIAGSRDGAQLTSYVIPEPNQTGGPRVVRINLVKAAAEGDGGPYLEDGDVVMVMKKIPKPVYVRGLVRKPGEFELSPNRDLYMLEALALAGGCTMPVADKVVILRRVEGEEEPIVIKTSIREAKADGSANVRLMAGDTVSVEETPATIVMRTITDVLRIGVGSTIPLF
ncbi:MAG TPA: polysaccharide biosynthesis/export family protein [Thermoguttaceae bacterium]|nr:polysaccharide biosynthesis/export family protein [Thermoguttaceae bacterium]